MTCAIIVWQHSTILEDITYAVNEISSKSATRKQVCFVCQGRQKAPLRYWNESMEWKVTI